MTDGATTFRQGHPFDQAHEPTDLDLAILDRLQMRLPAIGPLTLDQQESVEAYERYCEEMAAEYEAQEAAGGRTICPECGNRSVKHRSVVTLGYAGHPGAEWSDLAECERDECAYVEI